MKNPCDLKPGDVIGFSGRSWISAGINLATFGVPLWGISHVGIVGCGSFSRFRLFESTNKYGVYSQNLELSISEYDGRVWAYQLSRPLFMHELTRLTKRLSDLTLVPYDIPGAMRSGGVFVKLFNAAFRGEDLTSLFCSELVAESLSYIGVFPTANASRWNPNHLVRKLRRMGIVNPPVRLK